MPTVDLAGLGIYYELAPSVAGEHAPVVMLSNSLGSDLRLWDGQMAMLTSQFRVLRYDTRGHGRSMLAGAPFGIDDLGGDVLGLLDALSVERVHFCGLSMGGMVAQWLGIHAPARVVRLAICNSAARIGSAALWNARIDAVAGGGLAAIVDGVLGRWLTERFRWTTPHVAEAMKSMILSTPAQGYMAACAALRDADLRSQLGMIRVPTLVIGGTRDQSTPLADAHFLAEHISGARFVELDAAHLSNIEQADQFNAALAGFLKGDA